MEDPKKRIGDTKDPLHLVPTEAVRQMARVMKLGAAKYGEYNWRASDGVELMTYAAAIHRHLGQFIDGEDADDESGECHLAHIMASCAILIDARRVGKLGDNRPKLPESEPDRSVQQTCANDTCMELRDGYCTNEEANARLNCTGRKLKQTPIERLQPPDVQRISDVQQPRRTL